MSQTPADAKRILFVLGMHRSGTSALTRVLSLCGATLPAGLVGADSSNPGGYWEPFMAIVLNEEILRRQGTAAFDPTLREEGFDADQKAASIAAIRDYMTTLPNAPLVVIKDPRITVLSELWFEAARKAGFDVAAVIAVRHPQEAVESCIRHVESLYKLSGVLPELGSAWWLKYNLLAERHTRGVPHVFVEYANLLDDWRREIKRISTALKIELDPRDERAVEEFLTPDFRHQRQCGPVTDPIGTDWNSTVYEAMRAAAADQPWDRSALDRVFEAYRVNERKPETPCTRET